MKKLTFGFFLKTFIGDIKYVERLIKSYDRFNVDEIKMVLMCPNSDLEEFKKLVTKNIFLYEEETLAKYLVDEEEYNEINTTSSRGYFNQSILKLCFWELGFFENYFCVDSEVVFIKDFYFDDFMFDDSLPYTFLVEDNELKVDPYYFDTYWKSREVLLEKIKKTIGLIDQRILTIHGMTNFSSHVLKSLKNDFMIKKGFEYKDLLKTSGYEFSWYNFWLQKNKTIPIKFREPIIKTFHFREQHTDYLKKNITINDIARGYLGYLINSNYSRDSGVVDYENSNYIVPFSEIIKSFMELIKILFRRLIYFK